MYIAPNSTIYILKACPCDPDFGHTLDFESIEAQTAYFSSLMKYQFTAQTYQRYGKNSLKIATKADNLYDCNYLMFQNTSFGNKWFYAFITKAEYINNETSEVTYFIDPLQTYAFDYWLRQCYVEREHVADDTVGKHTVSENIAAGEQISKSVTDFPPVQSTYENILYLVSEAADGTPILGGFPDGYPCAIASMVEKSVKGDELGNKPGRFLTDYIENGRQDSVAAAYVIPSYMLNSAGNIPADMPRLETTISKPDKIGNYTPHNNKILCYPYTFLRVTNNNGDQAEFKFENFSDDKAKFTTYTGAVPQPSALCAPMNYDGVIGANLANSISLSGFPQMPWVGDVYKAWLAQNRASLAFTLENAQLNEQIGFASALLGGVADVARGDVYKGVTSAATGMFNSIVSYQQLQKQQLATMQDKQAAPNSIKGLTGASGIVTVLDKMCFTAYTIQPKEEYAIMIDHYFDMYGYQVNELKTPQHNSRTEWNYVKTSGCLVAGKLPADDAKMIQQIFDNGITFWHNPAHIGNYMYTNSIKG